MKLIVVEGPDGSGKSTLIENLRYATDRYFCIFKPTGPPRTSQNLYGAVRHLGALRYGPDVPIVVDRHPLISEPIYGVALRNEDIVAKRYSAEEVQFLLDVTVDRLIYCRPPAHIIAESLGKNRQLKGVSEQVGKIIGMYDERMKTLRQRVSFPVLTYDWTSNNNPSLHHLFFGSI